MLEHFRLRSTAVSTQYNTLYVILFPHKKSSITLERAMTSGVEPVTFSSSGEAGVAWPDILIIALYFALVLGVGIWVSKAQSLVNR